LVYTLRYKRGIGAAQQSVIDPSPETIDFVLDEMLPGVDCFIVLYTNKKIENCCCIQSMIKKDNKPFIEYMVEVHFKSNGEYTFYRKYFLSVDEVKKMFRMFALGIIPVVDDWDDVTDEVNKIMKRQKLRNKNG